MDLNYRPWNHSIKLLYQVTKAILNQSEGTQYLLQKLCGRRSDLRYDTSITTALWHSTWMDAEIQKDLYLGE